MVQSLQDLEEVDVEKLNYEKVLVALQSILQKSINLNYVPDSSVIIDKPANRDIVPTFSNYLIRVFQPDVDFIVHEPRIGSHFRTTYRVAIEIFTKSPQVAEQRLLSGSSPGSKGIFDLVADVLRTLEHNTLGILDPYPGNNISEIGILTISDVAVEGVSLTWSGNQITKD